VDDKSGSFPPASGSILGATGVISGKPAPATQIVINNIDDGTSRVVTSDEQGTFEVKDVTPGHYQLKANKDSFVSSPESSVMVEAGHSVRIELTLTEGSAVPVATGVTPKRGFFGRLSQAYASDWKATTTNGSEPKYRWFPPVTNPPYPFAVWPIGGTPWIGYPGARSYPLTTALQTGSHSDWWKKANTQLYGWVDIGANASTSHDGPYANAPAAYAQVANTVSLDQATLDIERVPDSVQKEHFDWDFRLTNLYGFDYRFTTASGYFSQQLLNNPKPDGTIGDKLGYDPVMAYIDPYLPRVADGMDVRIGRYISLPDIEAQLAPNNYLHSFADLYLRLLYTDRR
jgi:hypothetical protein